MNVGVEVSACGAGGPEDWVWNILCGSNLRRPVTAEALLGVGEAATGGVVDAVGTLPNVLIGPAGATSAGGGVAVISGTVEEDDAVTSPLASGAGAGSAGVSLTDPKVMLEPEGGKTAPASKLVNVRIRGWGWDHSLFRLDEKATPSEVLACRLALLEWLGGRPLMGGVAEVGDWVPEVVVGGCCCFGAQLLVGGSCCF